MNKQQTKPDYFGDCPTCHTNDGMINIGKGHWQYCLEHKTRWLIGANLFSGWRNQTEDEQREIYDSLGFDEFQTVEPWYCPKLLAELKCKPFYAANTPGEILAELDELLFRKSAPEDVIDREITEWFRRGDAR